MTPRNKDELIKIVLLSDLHLDFDYTPGSANHCDKVLCCRSDSGTPSDPKDAAGFWGDYNCDLPLWTFQEVLKQIREVQKPDYVFWGGDSIPHNLDTLVFDTNVEIMQNVTKILVDGLPDHKGKIFPAIGNHDTYPQDVFTMTKNDKNFQTWAPSWLQFIDDEVNKESFKNNQYFAK